MKKHFTWALLVVVFLFNACDSASDEEIAPLLPSIQVGDAWIMSRIDSIGVNYPAVDPPLSISIQQDTIRVQEEIMYNEESWFKIGNREGAGFSTPMVDMLDLFAFREDGIWRLSRDSLAIQIIQYPVVRQQEYDVVPGIISQLAVSDSLFESTILGQIPVLQYQHRYTTSFKPLPESEHFSDYVLVQEFVTESLYSKEVGLVKVVGFYISPFGEENVLRVVGTRTWELVEYVPASGQVTRRQSGAVATHRAEIGLIDAAEFLLGFDFATQSVK